MRRRPRRDSRNLEAVAAIVAQRQVYVGDHGAIPEILRRNPGAICGTIRAGDHGAIPEILRRLLVHGLLCRRVGATTARFQKS